jgi:hypothetical protein
MSCKFHAQQYYRELYRILCELVELTVLIYKEHEIRIAFDAHMMNKRRPCRMIIILRVG